MFLFLFLSLWLSCSAKIHASERSSYDKSQINYIKLGSTEVKCFFIMHNFFFSDHCACTLKHSASSEASWAVLVAEEDILPSWEQRRSAAANQSWHSEGRRKITALHSQKTEALCGRTFRPTYHHMTMFNLELGYTCTKLQKNITTGPLWSLYSRLLCSLCFGFSEYKYVPRKTRMLPIQCCSVNGFPK